MPMWHANLSKRRFLLWGVLCLLAGYAAPARSRPQEKSLVKYHSSFKVRVISGLVYATYGQQRLSLDLYLPLGPAQDRPGVVVVRGGGWLVGDRKRFAHVASALADRGVVAASIEYRTADKALFPAAIQDVKAAIRWLRAHAAQYGIDPEAIGTIGGSSGAHMALLAALTAGMAEFEGTGGNPATPSNVQAAVAMAVPADLLALTPENKLTVGKFLGSIPEQNAEAWRRASPISHARPDGPPVLLLHGADDDSVPTSQSTSFAEQYRRAGATAEVHILSHAPHAFWNYLPCFNDAMDRAAAFFLAAQQEKHRKS
jgi:arylsulfatase A